MIRNLRLSRVQYDVDTIELIATMTVAPSLNHAIIIDNTIKRLKAAGIWTKIVGLWAASHTQQATLINWKTRRVATAVGAVAFTPYRGIASTADTVRVQCNEIDFSDTAIWTPANSHAFAYTTIKGTDVASSRLMQSTTGQGTVDMRYSNTSGGSVIQVNSANAAATQLTGAPATGSVGASRYSETILRRSANGVPFGVNYTEAMPANATGFLTWAGSSGVSNLDTQGFATVGVYLTDAEMTTLHNIAKYYLDSIALLG